MTCASCGRANRTGARFCGGCGTALVPRCPTCGAESEPGAQFCDACGASLVERSTNEGIARKVVTIVFADLIGSMSLQEGLDPESVSRLMEAYHRAVSVPVEAEGGTVVQLLGDGVMCAFGVPRVAEDDAIRAVRAAVGMQRAFREFLGEHREVAGKIGLRVAVNTGEVVVSDDYTAGIGDPLNVAARLQQEAHDGDVLIGEATQRLVAERVTLEPIGVFTLKGRAERVAAYRVVSLDRPAGAAAAPFVGRDDELRRITSLYDATVAARGARLAVLLGSPGLGKSRLIAELTRRLGDTATVLCAHCDAAGGATFAPLAEALRAQLHLDAASSGDALRAAIDAVVPGDEAERARVAAGIGALLAGTPALPEETFFVVRRLLAALASERPLVLAIDDVQWAEPLLLDLIEHLVQWGAGVPLLLLAAARPELRDTRSSLTVPGGLVSDVLTLAGLDAGAATRLAASVIGADALPAAVAGRVLATSEGNPLFLGELVRMLVNDGALKREGDRWTAGVELADLEMPPTIQALLAARIERLRPEERLVLERAAVVGRQFSRAAVAHLLPREAQADLDVRLESLRRSELIEPDTGWLLGEPALRFHHVLIRDAAYRRLLRNTRAELHGRFADWLESRVGASVEHDEAIGWHLEQAHEHLRELGPLSERGRAFGERSARYLAAAGRRALARDDLRPAVSLLGRALDRLDAEDPARADLALDWCEALLAAGDVGPAVNAIAELGRFAGASARYRGWHTCFTGQLAVLTDPQALRASADAVAAAADSLAAAGDAAGEAKAHSVHANALARLGRIGASEAALDRALAAARRARDRRRANAVLAGAPVAALWGPSPVTRASGRCLDVVRVLRITQGAPAVEAVALRCQAVLEALRGHAEAARRMIASSRRMVEELGITQRLLEADVFAGLIELLEGDAVAAERFLRTAYDGLREHGLGIDAAQAAALLGRALLAQGRAAEAEALSHESETLAGDDLKAAIAWRGVRAEALARRGEHAAAIALARAAVEVAAATDDLLDHADARRALAVVLQAAGQSDEAETEEERAIELWETKGATLLAERARRDLGRAEQAPRPPAEQEKVATAARRRVPANAATANAARMDAAVAARDLDAFLALLAEGAKSVHHPTGVTYEERESLEAYKALLRAEDLTFTHEPIATLGDSLALCRGSLSFGVAEDHAERFGATINDTIHLIEVDAHGLRARTEFFAVDRLGDAVARLYERYADLVSEGLDRDRAAATARSVATFMGAQLELDALREAFHPDVEYLDHRAVGFPSGRGVESLLLGFQSLFDVVDHFERRVDEVLALATHGVLVRLTTSGIARSGGGAYEHHSVQLWTFGPDGRVQRMEFFEGELDEAAAIARFEALIVGADGLVVHNEQLAPNREAEALARFDELRAPASASFANATSRTQVEFERCWQERRWEDAIATYASAVQLDDRRALVGLNLVGDEFLTNLRMLFEIPESRWHTELIATRGERLALFRAHFSGGAAEGGQIVAEHLTLNERDTQNRTTALVVFDLDQLDAAYAELDRRYAAGEGAPHATLLASMDEFRRAAAIGDRNALARLLPDHFTMESHRRFGSTGTRLSRDEYIASMGVVEGLAVQGILRLDHLRTSATAAIGDSTWYGTRDGGDFELPVVFVFEHEGGRFRAWELFDREQLGAAFARYEELMAGATQVARIENAATRSSDRFIEAWNRRQWERIASGFSAGFRQIDRRGMGQLDLDLEQHLASLRLIFEKTSSRFTAKVIATRGERLALTRSRFEATTRSAGPSEAETLTLVELDDRGDRNVVVMFDPENLDAAYAELDARYAAGEAADLGRVAAAMSAFNRAFADRDWDALAAQCAPDIIVNDHRLLGWETLHGAAAYLAAVRSLVDLAPDARLRLDHVTMSEHGYLVITVWAGTREGGAFEAPSLMVCELDEHARVRRFDQYDLDRFDEARSRFEVLGAGAPSEPELRPDPLRIPPNSATGIFDRWREAFEARDWQALERLCAPALVYEDRRRMDLISGDPDMFLANSRLLADLKSPRIARTVLATAGDRLALEHLLWASDDGEVEVLQIVEADAEGRFLALIGFDADDRRAASIELRERYFRSDEGQLIPARSMDLARALDDRDLVRTRAALDEEFVFHDHRRTGVGRIGSLDDYIASLAAMFDQTRDGRSEDLYRLAAERHGSLSVARTVGTLVTGGEFESIYVRLQSYRAGRHVASELFELDELETARARFEALRPDPLRIPPNAATRAMDRWTERAEARDFDALESLFSPGLIWEDHRKLFRDSGDRDRLLASIHVAVSSGARAARTTIATAGDRLELAQVRFCLFDGATLISEIELLQVAEVDAEGHVVAAITFDPEDRHAASLEVLDRYVRGEGARFTPPSTIAFLRAMNAHDISGVRAELLDDFYFHDHRRTGVGRIEGADEYVASLSPMWEMSPDMASDTLYHIAVEEHGSLNVGRTFGTLADGGEFESIFARIVWYENGRNVGTELFELEDLDRVRSLFEQRRPGPLRIPPNAATRAMDRLGRARGARDWDAMLQMCSPAMVFEDRSRGALLVGGRDMFIASSRVVTSYEARVSQTLLATTGDRLALRRLQFAGTTGGGAAEAEALSLVEVDAEGRIAAIVAFDPGDRRAASVELCDRYFRSDEMRAIPAGFAAGMRAMNARDLEALRAALPDDFFLHDHRRTGLGRVEGAPPFIQSLAVLFDQAPDMVVETLYTVGTNEHGVLEMAHMFGKLAASGGEFEAVYLRLGMYQGDRIVGMELFEPEDLEVARARFEALRPRD